MGRHSSCGKQGLGRRVAAVATTSALLLGIMGISSVTTGPCGTQVAYAAEGTTAQQPATASGHATGEVTMANATLAIVSGVALTILGALDIKED